jgi:hypothetical protein
MLPRVRLREDCGYRYAAWWCPGCACEHEVPLRPAMTDRPGQLSEGFIFKGTTEEPTIKPTVIHERRRGAEVLVRCHSRVAKGEIEYS